MRASFQTLLLFTALLTTVPAAETTALKTAALPVVTNAPPPAPTAVATVLELRYDGKVTENDARFTADLEVESTGKGEASLLLFDGELAMPAPKLPQGLSIKRDANQYSLTIAKPGKYKFQVELIAKITRTEPWNQINFTGPAAVITSVAAQTAVPGAELQLLTGTVVETTQTNKLSRVRGFLGVDRAVSLRWSSYGTAEVARKALLTADTVVAVHITPTVIKYTTTLRYEILQGKISRLTLALPAAHALTKLQGESIRDWQVKADGERQVLTVEFIKPVEKNYSLILFSEQTVEATPYTATLSPPAPLEIEREAGALSISAEDTTVEIDTANGLRQVNAVAGSIAGYRFNGRPFNLAVKLKRIEPVVNVFDRVTARLEETRLLINHGLTLTVEKAGIYNLDLTPPPGIVVTEVRGEAVEDWKIEQGKLRVNFSSRILGTRRIDVQLEQALKIFPEQITATPIRVIGATKETFQIGAASVAGLRLKTADLTGLREIPVNTLTTRGGDELLAFTGDLPEWKLTLATEKLSARVVAEVFNLVTVGDGLVGGSATIRYGILNQGVQEFKVRLPAHWKNVEFTGANIRRKEPLGDLWTITLQDKAWGGYTLVITYDYQFDPKGAALDLAGAHALEVERETGSVGVMTAASLKLDAAAALKTQTGENAVRLVDETELSTSDRSLATRPLLLAYKYTGTDFKLAMPVTRFDEEKVLEAVADRTELTTVLTEQGQMLTQASFMVKNNDKQFQKFKLPTGAKFWASYVNGQTQKAERDGDWVMVPLPRGVNRDQAFAVDVVYAQEIDFKKSFLPRAVALQAPFTDIPNTYAEWQLFVPVTQRIGDFGGNMSVARGTVYGVTEAWQEFIQFYGNLIEHNTGLIAALLVLGLVAVIGIAAIRRGVRGVAGALAVFAILLVLGGMMLPALGKAKAKAQRIKAVSNLKQIGLAARIFANDNGDRFPSSFEEMKDELGTEKILLDPNSGRRFVYVGAGKNESDPNAIIAYSPTDDKGRAVAFADGSVQQLSEEKFQEAIRRDALVPRAFISANAPATLAPPAVTTTPSLEGRIQVSGQVVNGGAAAGGGIGSTVTPAGIPVEPVLATGVRPIRIDIPRTGQSFTFTKVLNVGNEPLSVQMSAMKLSIFRGVQMVVQVTAFLLGLLLVWRLWHRPQRSNFWLTTGLALIIGSVGSLLIVWRLLGSGFIVAAPLLVLIVVIWLAWKNWPRRTLFSSTSDTTDHSTQPEPPGIPPAVALIAFLLVFGISHATAKETTPVASSGVSIISASYTGTVKDKVATIDATIQLSADKSGQTVALFGNDVVIPNFTSKSGNVKLQRTDSGMSVILKNKGDATVELKLLVKLSGDVTKRTLGFSIPPALSSRIAVTLDETDADVDFPTAVSFKRASTNQQTRVEAVIGSGERVEMRWTPRVKRAAEIAATVMAQNVSLVTLSGGAVNTRATLDYQITQGELRTARVRLPAGHRLLRVEAEGLRTWSVGPMPGVVSEGGEQILTVELVKAVSPAWRLTVETEKATDMPPVQAKLDVPHALDVKRETGIIGLRGGEELIVTVESAKELQRVDADEFARVAPDKRDGVVSAFRFLKPEFELDVKASPVLPQIEAVVRNTVRIGAEQASLNSAITYTIKRAGVFSLKVVLPAGQRLDGVVGNNVLQWLERTENNQRVLEVTLKERTMGAYQLHINLSQSYKEPPKSLALSGVQPFGAQKLSGFITVSADHGVAVKTAVFDGLTEIPAASLGAVEAGNSALAYKFIAANPQDPADWKLSVTTEAVEPWVRAEIMNTITLTETLVSGRSLVRYDIANAPVKEFRLKIPAALKNVEITGANIRRRDQNGEEWRVELQSKVRGSYVLTVTWEQPKDARVNLVTLAGLSALGVERETGALALIARPPLQLTEKTAGELLSKIDTRELPEWAGRADDATVLAFKYLRPGYQLGVELKRYEEAAVLQALVDKVQLSTVVADDGQMMTEMSLAIRNNGRQHLEIELPPGAKVWSAFVAGQPVRPSKRGGKLLLPLERSANDATIAIEVTYVSEQKFPKARGPVEMISPKLDVPLKNAHWDLYLPPDYDYSKFEGSMNKGAAEAAPVVQWFTRSEYTVQEKAKAEQQKAGVKFELFNLRNNLSGGNVREAVGNYNRAKGQQGRGNENDKELRDLEQDVRRAQSSNLIQAQQSFYNDNATKLGDQQLLAIQPAQPGAKPNASPAGVLSYDADVAGLQWDALCKAQEIVAAKVAPLRVNLPTRGQRLSFSQALQTEVQKPMNIQLFAANTKTTSWTQQALWCAAGFAALWALVTVLGRRKAV